MDRAYCQGPLQRYGLGNEIAFRIYAYGNRQKPVSCLCKFTQNPDGPGDEAKPISCMMERNGYLGDGLSRIWIDPAY